MTDEHKRYKKLESVLQQISKQIIALPEEEVKRNNVILNQVSDIQSSIYLQKVSWQKSRCNGMT